MSPFVRPHKCVFALVVLYKVPSFTSGFKLLSRMNETKKAHRSGGQTDEAPDMQQGTCGWVKGACSSLRKLTRSPGGGLEASHHKIHNPGLVRKHSYIWHINSRDGYFSFPTVFHCDGLSGLLQVKWISLFLIYSNRLFFFIVCPLVWGINTF